MPDGQSKAAYIIICDGRIGVAVARDPLGRIQAASNCAAALVTYYGDRLGLADTEPISNLQHEMMELATGKQRKNPDEMVAQMFTLLDELEDSFE